MVRFRPEQSWIEGYVKSTPKSSDHGRKVLGLAFRASCRRIFGKPEGRLRGVSDAERYTAGLQYRYGRPMPYRLPCASSDVQKHVEQVSEGRKALRFLQ